MLQRRALWFLAAILLPLPFLLLKSLGASDAVWQQRLWDAGHIPLFALWALAALYLLPLPRSVPWLALRCGMLLLLGFSIELIQRHTGRSFSLWDVYLDACGTALGMRLGLLSRRRLYLVDIALAVLIGIGIRDAAVFLFDRACMSWQFPTLWQADQINPELRLQGSAHRDLVRDGSTSLLKVTYGTEPYSGLELVSLMSNWRGYRTLEIDVMNPSVEPLAITCRVHDTPHYANGGQHDDRFNRTFVLAQGWTTLDIALADIASAPTTRRMQMGNIATLMCFTIELPSSRTLYYREIRLHR